MNSTRTSLSRRGVAVLSTLALSVTGALAALPAAAAPEPAEATVTDAQLTWGVKESFRNYITSPVASGTATLLGNASGSGPYVWSSASGEAAEDGTQASLGFGPGNGVHFQGHQIGEHYALDLELTNPRIVINSPTSGELRLDVKGREYVNASTVGEVYELRDVLFAELDGTALNVVDGTATWSDVAVTLTAAGEEAFGGFYNAGEKFDPLNLSFTMSPAADPDPAPEPEPAPEPNPEPADEWQPKIAVFLADGTTPVGDTEVSEGEELVVKGTGFDPEANVGGRGRPIPDTLPQGAYVVFGSFAPDWRPSAGAESGARKVGSQGWVLTADTLNQVPANFQGAIRGQWVELEEDGSFIWTVTLTTPKDPLKDGRFGIYTYAAGGVNNADQELSVLLNYQDGQSDEGTEPETSSWTTRVTIDNATAKTGLELTVSGEDYVNLPKPISEAGEENRPMGVYAALYDAKTTTFEDLNESQAALAMDWVMPNRIVDGAWTTGLKVSADKLRADGDYRVITWPAHGIITEDNVIDSIPLALTDAQKEALGLSSGGSSPVPTPPPAAKPKASVEFDKIDLGGDRTQTVTASGFTPGEDVEISLHSEVINLGTVKADLNGVVVYEFTVPTSLEPGQHRIVLTGLTSGVEVSASFTVVAAATEKQTTETTATDSLKEIVCTTETVPAKPGTPRLNWGIKSSFVSYVQGGIANGSISTLNGASRSGGGFGWGAGSGSFTDAGIGTLRFPGSVQLTGHGGILDVRISNLQVRSTGGRSGTLVGYVRSQDISGNVVANGTVTLANLRFASLSASGGTASATLTSAGARAFAGFYNAGDAMDNLTVSITGAQGERTVEVCYDADGNRVNPDGTPYTGDDDLALTGLGDTGGLLALIGALTLSGAALLITRRHRAHR